MLKKKIYTFENFKIIKYPVYCSVTKKRVFYFQEELEAGRTHRGKKKLSYR